MGTVLVVATDEVLRERLGESIRAEGLGVLACPGPSAPDYACPGVSGQGCPMVEEADVVVLDLDLDGDLLIEGTTAVELVAYYLSEGRPVVTLAHEGIEFTHPFAEERLRVLRWPPRATELRDALRSLVGSGDGRKAAG